MTDEIKRTTLMVRDAEVAARWYESVFGMSRWMDTEYTLSGTQLAAGRKGDRTRLIILKCRHDTIGMIGLLQWIEPAGPQAPTQLPTTLAFGAPVFVVAAENVRNSVERGRSLGSRIHCEPHDWTVTGADGRLKDMSGASFWDLDGYFYEVNQVLAVRDAPADVA